MVKSDTNTVEAVRRNLSCHVLYFLFHNISNLEHLVTTVVMYHVKILGRFILTLGHRFAFSCKFTLLMSCP